MGKTKSRSKSDSRLLALRRILFKGVLTTQEDLRNQLESEGFSTTQTTVSRDLRRLGAVKMLDDQGHTVYRLISSEAPPALAENVKSALQGLVVEMKHNGSLIVIRTEPGSASLIARELDIHRPAEILGTIAGDDTVFVAPPHIKNLDRVFSALKKFLAGE
ncbi:MAG: arginine repressor [Bdellovibrionales bacterium]|nr:arginine repressor [Bdellovibrionales bacterium]